MTEQRPQNAPSPAKTSRIIYAAIIIGIVTLFGVLLYLRTATSPEIPDQTAGILKWVALGALVASAIISYMLRSRIPLPGSGIDRDTWWVANQPKAVASWAVAESGGLVAIVVGWLIGNTTVMALGAGVALALLFVSRPGALEGAA